MDSRPPLLMLVAMVLLVPAASADDCLLHVAGQVIAELEPYPRCPFPYVGQGSLSDCFCPWREPLNEEECDLPDNFP